MNLRVNNPIFWQPIRCTFVNMIIVTIIAVTGSVAAALDLSGVVTDDKGNPLWGAMIVIASNGGTTSTDSTGHWKFQNGTTNISSIRYESKTRRISRITLERKHLGIQYCGADAAGRGNLSAITVNAYPSLLAPRTHQNSDTILFAWNGTVRLRLHIQNLISGDLGSIKIDTSTISNTILWNNSITYGKLLDARDDQLYRTVKIGTQTWMAENLNFQSVNSICQANSIDSCVKYGRLYRWSAAMAIDSSYDKKSWGGTLPYKGICPTGWHLPGYEEYTLLFQTVGGRRPAWSLLKSTAGWPGKTNGVDQFGYRILPASVGYENKGYSNGGDLAAFWTATESGSNWAKNMYLNTRNDYIIELDTMKLFNNAVRCISD